MGLFGKLFSSGSKSSAVDFSLVVADMHSHLIPGIDDGVKTVEESMNLITELYHLGFRKFITTPHIMTDFYKNTPKIINEGLAKVRDAIAKSGMPITIEAAAEYYLDEGFTSKVDNEKLLTFGDNYLLFEISYINCPDNLREMLFKMQVQGYKPVLAHPERYPFWYNKFEEYQNLKDTGVLLQININSLSGYYSPMARKVAERMIDNNLVDFIGTDAHGTKHTDVLKKTLQTKYLQKLITSGKLLNSQL